MKLNWFSPLLPQATDIAHYTSRVLPALSSLCELTLWTTKERWPKSLENFAEVRRYGLDRIPWTELNRADMTFYNIGNNPKFHWPIWHVSRVHPGVVVLHDFRLHHFFDWVYRCHYQDPKLYLEMMKEYYGEAALADAQQCFTSQAENIDYMAEHYPLTELALKNALGVMVHTKESFADLEMKPGPPVSFAPLPYSSRDHFVSRTMKAPYRLVIFGYLGRNRRLESFFKALATLPERESFKLDVYGAILEKRDLLQRQIRDLKLSGLVTLRGFVPEDRLDQALSNSHLAINLRFPSVGEASGSQLRIWSHALPSLVSESGWYASLSPDAVCFVRPDENEISDIQRCLRDFLAAPERFARMGVRGYEKLRNDHSPRSYAGRIVELASRAKEYRPRLAAESLARRAGVSITEWFRPIDLDRPLRSAIGKALSLVNTNRCV